MKANTHFCAENHDLLCFLVTKISAWKGKYKRLFSVGNLAITTYNPQTLEITNQWLYEDFLSIKCNERVKASNSESPRLEESFSIQVRKKGKVDTMRFSSDFTLDIITEALRFQSKFASERNPDRQKYDCVKVGWANQPTPVVLEVTAGFINQIDASRGNVLLKSYPYKDIKRIMQVSDRPGGFILEIGEQRRRHFFTSDYADSLIKDVREAALDSMALDLTVARDTLSFEDFITTRLGLCSKDEQLTSIAEFKVQKLTSSSDHPVRRVLCLSETCIVERDPVSYTAICARTLKTIICLIRDLMDPQSFQIEYDSGEKRNYSSHERDTILASLLDGARGSGNYQIFVTSNRAVRSHRILPYNQLLDEDAEQQLMRHIVNVPPGLRRSDSIRRFNANVPYNGLTYASNASEGLFSDNKGRLIVGCLEAVLLESYGNEKESSPMNTASAHDKSSDTIDKIENQLQCLHRLFASKSGYQAFTSANGIWERVGALVLAVLRKNNEAVDNATVEMLCSLLQPMHANVDLRYEQLNKQSMLASRPFVEHLLKLLVSHVEKGSGALVVASMLDFLTYAVCAPYSETTSGEIFDMVLELVAEKGRSFYKLFHHPSMTIVKGASLVTRAIVEESNRDISKRMQMLSLTEGAFLKHVEISLLSTGRDLRVLTNRQLSGHLIELWSAENNAAMQLLQRCLPFGLLEYLYSKEKVPVSEADLLTPRNNLQTAISQQQRPLNQLQDQLRSVQISVEAKLETLIQHWNLQHKLNWNMQRKADSDKTQRQVVLRKRRRLVKASMNWRMLCYQFGCNHAKANLIWNEKTREEFRQAIAAEIRQFQQEVEFVQPGTLVSWNHAEFSVLYNSLADEIRIGDYYLRMLLNEGSEDATPIHNPTDFFNNVYHRFLLAPKSEMKCLCLRAMSIVYERHYITIGKFADSKYIVQMLQRCTSIAERDHYLLLISKLAMDKSNALELISSDIIPLLVDMAVLAHLHTTRAKIHSQTNVIEHAASTAAENESKEWYYNDKSGQRQGPHSFQHMKDLYRQGVIFEKTDVWAEGLDKWCHLSAVAQFRWTVCVERQQNLSPNAALDVDQPKALFNQTDLCTLVLDTLIHMCAFFPSRDEFDAVIRPLPRVKKVLSEPVLLYQVVQLLLTYDPAIVQRVGHLVNDVMADNPFISRLYLSGVFFFILMYNGSNVLPVARFLHSTHLKQAFRSTLSKSELAARSVLCPLLPEATIFYLNVYGPERYAEVFLGEFENPEIIWNSEMRRYMIERIAIHVADFSSRLSSNVKSLYSYCPIPPVEYPQLKDELFCHFYYLRHLTDEQRFPDWPIREPVNFLRSCLEAWHQEIHKKPATMSLEQACEQLGLSTTAGSWKDQSVVRRAYFKLAAKYHPDKNPEGREQFEKINYAYEFLTSALIREKNNALPDIQKVVICLRAQSIVFSRHLTELSPYKYAGYAQLIKTIDLESADDALFSANGRATLLIAAVELCYWTLKCSAQNAEQLRRDGGLEALYKTFDRCVAMIGTGSKESDMPVEVCLHVCNCFAIAARFETCREKISEMKTLFASICGLLKFDHLNRLACAAAECVCAFSVCTLLQTQLFQAGVIWQLLPHLFRYDYTLNEGGVAHSEKTNRQAVLNRLARSSCEALACLAGFRAETPDNDGVQRSLRAMLTPYICRRMSDNDSYGSASPIPAGSGRCRNALNVDEKAKAVVNDKSLQDDDNVSHNGSDEGEVVVLGVEKEGEANRNDPVLKILNSNIADPYIIWDNSTRAELLDFVDKHRNLNEHSSDLFGAEFKLSVYAKELIVGEIFVRIYNSQPEFKLYEPKKVCMDLLSYLDEHCEELLGEATIKPKVAAKPLPPPPKSVASGVVKKQAKNGDLIDFSQPDPLPTPLPKPKKGHGAGGQIPPSERIQMVLEALRNALMMNPGVEILLIGHFQMISSYLRAYHLWEVQLKTLQIISLSANNKECVSDVARSLQLPLLLVLMVKLPKALEIILRTLIALTSNGAVVKEVLEYGGLFYILYVFIEADAGGAIELKQPASRVLAAELLAKLHSDKLNGPKWSRHLNKFLPPIFSDALRDNPSSALQMFDTTSENPELIWNDATRRNVRESVKKILDQLVTAQSVDPAHKSGAALPDSVAYQSVVDGEMIVGGVYLRLFVTNPSWTVRHPRQFTTELVEHLLELMAAPKKERQGELELVTKSLALLFSHHPSTADQIPAQGYLPQFCQCMLSADVNTAQASLLILSQLAESTSCVRAFGSLGQVVKGLHTCMKLQPALMREVAHSLKLLLKDCSPEISEQILTCGILPQLLEVLASNNLPGVSNPAAAKSEIADALKSCCAESRFGGRIAEVLKSSPIWAQYKDQRHDLFLPAASNVQAITSGPSSSSVSGYLTEGMFEPPPRRSEPPPR